jgi:HSP20 family protein
MYEFNALETDTCWPFSQINGGGELASFQKEMNSLMNNFFSKDEWDSSFYPLIDMKEQNNKYLIDADMPGMNESDIDLHDNILTIKGEKKVKK